MKSRQPLMCPRPLPLNGTAGPRGITEALPPNGACLFSGNDCRFLKDSPISLPWCASFSKGSPTNSDLFMAFMVQQNPPIRRRHAEKAQVARLLRRDWCGMQQVPLAAWRGGGSAIGRVARPGPVAVSSGEEGV